MDLARLPAPGTTEQGGLQPQSPAAPKASPFVLFRARFGPWPVLFFEVTLFDWGYVPPSGVDLASNGASPSTTEAIA
ncbi:hypothetical protein GCM10023334_033970 [Nonomuraea thailandensis]